jgi:catechol 2,3-dioxygenase-like lactoylglutathione lyase family enzyme
MKFTHIALQVFDLHKSIDFYETYCGLNIYHERVDPRTGDRVVWLSEPSKKPFYVLVLMPGAKEIKKPNGGFGHLGFDVKSKDEVHRIAKMAKGENCLIWDVMEEPYPVGTLCGVTDPDGNIVEFSYGQPLGK